MCSTWIVFFRSTESLLFFVRYLFCHIQDCSVYYINYNYLLVFYLWLYFLFLFFYLCDFVIFVSVFKLKLKQWSCPLTRAAPWIVLFNLCFITSYTLKKYVLNLFFFCKYDVQNNKVVVIIIDRKRVCFHPNFYFSSGNFEVVNNIWTKRSV